MDCWGRLERRHGVSDASGEHFGHQNKCELHQEAGSDRDNCRSLARQLSGGGPGSSGKSQGRKRSSSGGGSSEEPGEGNPVAGTGLKRREQGGPVAKGQAYLVGESGPEIIKPVESGNVIPNQNIKGIVDNINQSVGMDRGKTRTLIQPQITVETQVIPQPTPVPITRTVTVETMTKSKFNSTLARGIR